MALMKRVSAYIRRHGLLYTGRRAAEMLGERILHTYDRQYRQQRASDEALAYQRSHQPDGGLISVAIPVYNTRPVFLTALAESLLSQTYQHWEAVLYDGCSTDAASVAAMDALPDDPRIRVIHGRENAGISGNTNLAVAACRGDFIALCDHDDTLAPDALWRVAEAISRHQPDMLYSDEDKLTEDGRIHTDPHDKPDFCPDNLRSGNYICHLMVIRKTVLTQVGGLRPEFDGSQDHDLALRISEVTQRICHLPYILYHWRTVGTSMSHMHLAKCQNAAARAVTEHMERIGYPGRCTVEDGSLRLRYEPDHTLSVRTIRIPDGADYAYMNRMAAEAAEDVLLFIHERVTNLSDDLTQELLMYAQRQDVGAVTPMLTERTGRITHAGFALGGKNLANCRNRGLPGHAGGWHGLNRTSHNVSAVSQACFMVRRKLLAEIPFDEAFTGGLGMADWCLRLMAKGFRHVYTPHASAVCQPCEMLAPKRDAELFRQRWPELRDSCYSEKHDIERAKFTRSP